MKLIIHQEWYLQQVKDTFTNLQAPRLNWALRNAINTSAKQVERFTEKQVADISSAQSKRGVAYTMFGKKEILTHGFIKGGNFPKRVELKKMNGHVFQRVDSDKFPIAKQEGPSIAKVMSKPEIANAIAQYASERLTKNIQRQLARQEYATNKRG